MHRAAAVLLLVLALLLAACGGAGTRDAKVGGAPVTAPEPPAGATPVAACLTASLLCTGSFTGKFVESVRPVK